MSPSRVPSLRPVLAGAAVLGTLIGAGPASASAAPPTIEQPLQTLIDTASVVTATGNRQVAWTVQPNVVGGSEKTPIAVWTVKDGAATQIASLSTDTPVSVEKVEVGTAKDGAPIAFVAARGRDATILRLVRLDTGAVRTISSTRGGLPIGGVGIDNGRYYYTTSPTRTTKRSTASLWRATITGTSIGRATKLRTSQRGSGFADVVADRNRVAVKVTQPVDDGSGVFLREEWAFGTPRGAWRRAGETFASDGGYLPVTAGFTQDRKALVTIQQRDDANAARVIRTPIGSGKATTSSIGGDSQDLLLLPSFEPVSGRVLTRGTDATGASTVGYTAPVRF